MNNKSWDAAKFWFEASRFFENICLLAEAIANQLDNDGYKTIKIIHGLKFDAWDTGAGRLVFDRLRNHWRGRFDITSAQNGPTESDQAGEIAIAQEKAENVAYGFGVTFGVYDPESNVDPWIPLIYLFKGKLKGDKAWEDWRYSRELFTPSNLLKELTRQKRKILDMDVSKHNDINYAKVIIFELGAVCSVSDVKKIIKPSVEALRHENESKLHPIKAYLLRNNEDWQKVEETNTIEQQQK